MQTFVTGYILRIAEHLAAGSREGYSRGHQARILLRRLDIPGHVDFYVCSICSRGQPTNTGDDETLPFRSRLS
jgi:hypothetical protein